MKRTHMPPSLLKDGFLENGFTLSSVYHVVNLSLCRLFACHNVRPPLHHLPVHSNLTSLVFQNFQNLEATVKVFLDLFPFMSTFALTHCLVTLLAMCDILT